MISKPSAMHRKPKCVCRAIRMAKVKRHVSDSAASWYLPIHMSSTIIRFVPAQRPSYISIFRPTRILIKTTKSSGWMKIAPEPIRFFFCSLCVLFSPISALLRTCTMYIHQQHRQTRYTVYYCNKRVRPPSYDSDWNECQGTPSHSHFFFLLIFSLVVSLRAGQA